MDDFSREDFVVRHDEQGREILSDMPCHFVVPDQRRISTLDFHRQRLLEQREMMRRMIEDMELDNSVETFAEANDFSCKDPLDDEVAFSSDFELADDGLDGLQALAEAEYNRISAEIAQKAVTVTNNSPSEDAK